MSQRRLLAVQLHLRSTCANGTAGQTDETPRLRSPWSDADGSIRAAWQHGSKATYTRSDRKKGFRVLTEADHAFFEHEGWVLIPDAVPRENIEAVKDATVRTSPSSRSVRGVQLRL